MANYVRYGNPWVNSSAPPAITAAFLTALENALIQPSGGSESGHYGLVVNWAGTGNGFGATHVTSISRTSVPVSVTIDTTDQSPSGGLGSPSTSVLTSGGFRVFASTTNSNNSFCAGAYTINW